MQLLVLFLKKAELINQILHELGKNNIGGGTIIDGYGMASGLASMSDLPMFGTLRQIISNQFNDETKVLLMVVKDQDVINTANIIKTVIGDINQPNNGVLITIPVLYCEGIK